MDTFESTLRSGGGFLDALFSGRHEPTLDKEGRIFLDRDGATFRKVLDFLRSAEKPVVTDVPLLKELQHLGIVPESLFPEAKLVVDQCIIFRHGNNYTSCRNRGDQVWVETIDISQQRVSLRCNCCGKAFTFTPQTHEYDTTSMCFKKVRQ